MKKQPRNNSCKELQNSKKYISLQLEIEENTSDKLSKNKISDTLAQRIPRLPESKFFPGSCRNINASLNTSNPFNTVSANITTTQAINNSVFNQNNLSVQNIIHKEPSINFSQYSQKSDQSALVPK